MYRQPSWAGGNDASAIEYAAGKADVPETEKSCPRKAGSMGW